MNPLQTNQRVLRLFFVFSDKKINKSERLSYALTTLIILIAHLCAVLSAMCYFFKFMMIDFERSLSSLYNIFGSINVTYIAVVLLIQRRPIVAIFNKISEIYKKSKKPENNVLEKIYFSNSQNCSQF